MIERISYSQQGDRQMVELFLSRGADPSTPTDEGKWVETATVGNEGMVGVPVLLGGRSTGNGQAIAQVAGEAITIGADRFRAYVDSDGKLRQILFGYAQALFAQISQSVACNGVHPIQERCARWLLESHDRVSTDEFNLTQEFLADMLAVQRPSVSVAAGALQQAGGALGPPGPGRPGRGGRRPGQA